MVISGQTYVGTGLFKIPMPYLTALQEFAASKGIPPHVFLKDTDIPLRALLSPAMLVGNTSLLKGTENLLDEVQDPMLAFDYGGSTSIADHGLIGLAAKHTNNITEAARLTVKYSMLVLGTEDAFEFIERANTFAIRIRPIEYPRMDVARFHMLATLTNLVTIAQRLVGRQDALGADIVTTFSAPGEIDPERLPGKLSIQFDQPVNELRFSHEVGNYPIIGANADLGRVARDGCEEELERRSNHKDIVTMVRFLLRENGNQFPKVSETAALMGMSERTLKRRFKAAGTSYQKIKDSERFRQALILLEDPQNTLEDIAFQLGYSDASNFAKAFRGWAGLTPGRYKKTLTS